MHDRQRKELSLVGRNKLQDYGGTEKMKSQKPTPKQKQKADNYRIALEVMKVMDRCPDEFTEKSLTEEDKHNLKRAVEYAEMLYQKGFKEGQLSQKAKDKDRFREITEEVIRTDERDKERKRCLEIIEKIPVHRRKILVIGGGETVVNMIDKERLKQQIEDTK